ncbi:hypothetical protein HPB48_012332 [Haemaphysalis longicornis]|uniref:Uncharacterized protein n=1 Tax=Haemaphysalis longicornis TaxID=44386 RepID=A0A9J6G3Z6_HAELO|nr:hypothetical protein HPB48_012332 [Haemaphysalis longicornis]
MSSETGSRWPTVYHSRRRSQDLARIVIHPSGTPLGKIKPTELMQALAAATRLTPSEIYDSILQPRTQQNLIAVKTFRPSAQQKNNGSPCHNVRSSSHMTPAGVSFTASQLEPPHKNYYYPISSSLGLPSSRLA